jgi:hypothetical protein
VAVAADKFTVGPYHVTPGIKDGTSDVASVASVEPFSRVRFEVTAPVMPEAAYTPPSITTEDDGDTVFSARSPVDDHTQRRPPSREYLASNPSSRVEARESTRTCKLGSADVGARSSTLVVPKDDGAV